MSEVMSSAGLKGIANAGNTCYINSILQCLSNTPAFKYVLLNADFSIHPQSKTRGRLVESLSEFMRTMWSSQNIVMSTKSIRLALRGYTNKFEGTDQQDAQEFLLYLLAALNEETKVVSYRHTGLSKVEQDNGTFRSLHYWEKFLSSEASVFSNIFVGQLRSSVRCPLCKRTSTVYEIFWELSLPVPSGEGSVTIYNCLDKYFGGETLRNVCQFCKRQTELIKVYHIERLPPVLILWFKRFSANFTQKISSPIKFPRDLLDMEDYLSPAGRKRETSGSGYKLCAVSNHVGSSALYGHYTANCRKDGAGRWYLYDDARVSALDTSLLDSAEAGRSAYILMYQRC